MTKTHRTETRQCIYCLEHRTFSRTKKYSEFNAEHVVHRALAALKDNLTLVGSVCRDCNDFFGATFDRTLNRGTYEAVERFRHGIKPLDEFAEFVEETVRFVAGPGAHPFLNGARAKIVIKDAKIDFEFKAQIALKLTNGDWTHIIEQDLAEGSIPAAEEVTGDWAGLCECGRLEHGIEMANVLTSRGLPLVAATGQYVPGTVPVYCEYLITTQVARALAKIGFNYYAKTMEVTAPHLILGSAFNECRRFIRYGESPGYMIVTSDKRPILAHDTENIRHTNGHLVALEEGKNSAGRRAIEARLSLFNYLDWRVAVCPDYRGLSLPMGAHHWNIIDGLCEPIRAALNLDGTLRVAKF